MNNSKFLNEMDMVNKTCKTASAQEGAVKALMAKYQASEKVIKTLKNGIQEIGVYDKNGVFLTSYHGVLANA